MTVVTTLCAIAAFACAGLLARAWLDSRVPLLFWCMVCFAGLALNSALVVVDELTADVDLAGWRQLPAALGVLALCYGLILRAERR
jgi:hypothetical protein